MATFSEIGSIPFKFQQKPFLDSAIFICYLSRIFWLAKVKHLKAQHKQTKQKNNIANHSTNLLISPSPLDMSSFLFDPSKFDIVTIAISFSITSDQKSLLFLQTP